MMADGAKSGRLLASLSILCAVLACIMPTVSRMLFARAAPGDDSFFSVLGLMPALYLAGLIMAVIARRKAGKQDPLTKVALWLNLGLLAALVIFALWAMLSYQGR